MDNPILENWHALLAAIDVVIALVASAHVILHKQDPRAAIGWVGVIWLTPLVGSLLYYLFGINRIARRAARLRSGLVAPDRPDRMLAVDPFNDAAARRLGPLVPLACAGNRIALGELVDGNALLPLIQADEAFPAMLQAIDQSTRSITLCTYIFDADRAGHAFAAALGNAVRRGVEVRVLVDDVGARYSWRRGLQLLHRQGVPTAAFLPTFPPWHFRYSNLRNHRKVLVIDGRIGFTGGMNIRAGNYRNADPRSAIQDIQFRIDGPVVHQLQSTFALDWSFTTGERLEGPLWYGPPNTGGPGVCRAIADGPDEDIDRLQRLLHAAIATAQTSISIVTPYFIPEPSMILALSVAALKGIRVDIVLPERNNLRLVQWASTATLPPLIESGCHVWFSRPPFDHSKILIIDGQWSLIGSANWDQRSLRLNFELDVECFDRGFAEQLHEIVMSKIARSRPVRDRDLRAAPLWKRLRNGAARLASPYL